MNRIFIVLLFVLLVVVSCSRYEPQEGSVKPDFESDKEGVLTKEFTSEEIYIRPSQVIYHPRFKPELLTKQQLALLSKHIDKIKLQNKAVWFVRVLCNRNRHLTAKIYFMPDATSNRVRKGKYIYCRLIDLALLDLKIEDIRPPEYLEYIQVSLKDKPFTDQAEIPPQNSMLPFSVSENFTDEEIVEIVDFIRTRPMKTRKKTGRPYFQVKRNLPIMTIIKEVEVIKVRTGTQEHGLAGSGQVLEVKSTYQGYELIHVIEWVS